jgi:hypothetical protein
MPGNPTELLRCYHCANTVPHKRVTTIRGQELYEQDDRRRYLEDFDYDVYRCPTCQGVSFFGDFAAYPMHKTLSEQRLYPSGAALLPKPHKLASKECVPKHILKLYEEIWPLRHIAPSAFAGQIRRGLEFICKDQKAEGAALFQQLKNLTSRGVFPGAFAELTDLMRQIGNLGSHATEREVDFWDAELLDDFFRSIVEYVYIMPSKIARLKQRGVTKSES